MTRRRWIYQDGEMVEVPVDYVQPENRAEFHVVSDRHYDGLQATDGTDISTRTKHREYMRRHGLTTADDFTNTWKKAAAERQRLLEGKDKTRINDVVESVHKLRNGYRPTIRREEP